MIIPKFEPSVLLVEVHVTTFVLVITALYSHSFKHPGPPTDQVVLNNMELNGQNADFCSLLKFYSSTGQWDHKYEGWVHPDYFSRINFSQESYVFHFLYQNLLPCLC